MPDSEQPTCSICGQPFRDDEIAVKYRTWPQLEQLCHVTCVMALAKTEQAKTVPETGHPGTDMDQKEEKNYIQNDLLGQAADNHNKAEVMRIRAENADGEARQLYVEIADSFGRTARLIEELNQVLR
jgi:hypothetical protein